MSFLDELLRVIQSRPAYQRVFFALTLGVFLSCSMQVASGPQEQAVVLAPVPAPATPVSAQ